MKTVKQLLKSLNHEPAQQITPDLSIFSALAKMVDSNLGAILVVEEGVIQGMATERDFIEFLATSQNSHCETPICRMMTRKVVFVPPETSLDDAVATMVEKNICHLPVISDGHFLGIISIGDIAGQISYERQMEEARIKQFNTEGIDGAKEFEAEG